MKLALHAPATVSIAALWLVWPTYVDSGESYKPPAGAPSTEAPGVPDAEFSSSHRHANARVVIGRQTTRVVKPLRKDGYPDYFGAVNEYCSVGVNSRNNAVAGLVRAFGPESIENHVRDIYLETLGLVDLPSQGNYFVTTEDMVERWILGAPDFPGMVDEAEFASQFNWAGNELWSADEYPIVAEWLVLNEEPLKLIREAAGRRRYFDPVVPRHRQRPSLLAADRPANEFVYDAILALRARAMLRLNEGRAEAAWHDLHAGHRLALAAMSSPVGSYYDQSASLAVAICQWQIELIHRTRWSKAMLDRIEAEVAALPELPSLAERVDIGERYRLLDMFCVLSRDGTGAVQQLFSGSMMPASEEALHKALSDAWFDWNEPLRMTNVWYDRMVAAHRIADRFEREEALKKLNAELEKLGDEASSPGMFAMNWFTKGSARAAMGRMIGANFIRWLSYSSQLDAETREQYRLYVDFLGASLLLAQHRRKHGVYPEQWDDLAPAALAKVPRDVFAGDRPLRYLRQGHGFVLYSLGPNGVDEQGGVSCPLEDADDIAVRLDGAVAECRGPGQCR